MARGLPLNMDVTDHMHRRSAPRWRRSLAVLALGATLAVALAACGGGGNQVATGSSLDGAAAPGAAGPFETAVFWVRPSGDPERIDMPAYRDDQDARPLVVYGSVTNLGERAAAAPEVAVGWTTAQGQLAVETPARVIGSEGQEVVTVAAGGSADVLAVIDDAVLAAQLGELVPTLVVR